MRLQLKSAAVRPILGAKDIVAAIDSIVTRKSGTLVIHSSVPALTGTSLDASKWQFIQAMRLLSERGYTLVFPAFTFSYGRGLSFNINESRSETGILSDWIMALPEARRTPNPIFSFVVLGKNWPQFAKADHTDAYGDKSVLALMEELDAEIVMLGAKWDYCSFLHRMEQEHQVPYREFKRFEHAVDFGEGLVQPKFRTFVRRSDLSTRLNFGVIRKYAEADGVLRTTKLGSSHAESSRVRDVAAICRKHMANDPLFLLHEKKDVAYQLEKGRYKQEQPAFRVALLGAANLEFLQAELACVANDLIGSRKVDIYSPDFAQTEREIADTSSALYAFDPQLSIFCDTAESMLGTAILEGVDIQIANQRFQRWLSHLEKWRENTKSRIAILDIQSVSRAPLNSCSLLSQNGIHSAIDILRGQLRDFLEKHSGMIINASIATQEKSQVFDPRLWYLARTPWSKDSTNTLARRIGGIIAAETGNSIRAIIVDLDNTLWGGIAGEDGISGITLGEDGAGQAFRDFQQALQCISRRGIALAISSKNDEATALEIIDRHPSMVLQRKDFITWEINWNKKSSSIEKIANRLHISLSNILFIDDNPAEIREVKNALPAVRTLHLPTDPANYLEVLSNEVLLESGTLTDEDYKRNSSFKKLLETSELKDKSQNHSDFIKELGVSIRLRELCPETLGRASQLMVKTNQFNSTMRRYTADDLQKIISDQGIVATIEIKDCFNPAEIMGVLVISPENPFLVDSLLLSCRALGKGVERTLLRHLARVMKAKHGRSVVFQYIPSQKNNPVRKELIDAGFHEAHDGWFPGHLFENIEDFPVQIEDLTKIGLIQ